MINTELFGKHLQDLGFSFFSGVPCSYLKHLINYAINECEYVGAANEGDAVAIASGAYLGGRKAVVLMQNSGLTNAISPLTSLNYPFHLPLLGFVSLRGEPGVPDEPQHELMGLITPQLLNLMQVQWQYLSLDWEEVKSQLMQAIQVLNQNQPFFFVVKKGTFTSVILKHQTDLPRINANIQREHGSDELPTRFEALSVINSTKNPKTVHLATTGMTGRELYEIEDYAGNFYMVGSMGCISSLGLGLALTRKHHDIVVIDGDGSLLMRMGSLATNGSLRPHNMLHILLDNNAHDSTGGQKTVSHHIRFVETAAACGYAKSIYIHHLGELEAAIKDWKAAKQLTFLYLRIVPGSREHIGRPQIKPYEVKHRLISYLDIGSQAEEEIT